MTRLTIVSAFFACTTLAVAQTPTSFKGHTGLVNLAVFSPDERYILTGSYDWSARLYDTATGQELRVLTDHKEFIWAPAFTPDAGVRLRRNRVRLPCNSRQD